jgi:hypothetical protein
LAVVAALVGLLRLQRAGAAHFQASGWAER